MCKGSAPTGSVIGTAWRAALSSGGRAADRRPKVDPQLTGMRPVYVGSSRKRYKTRAELESSPSDLSAFLEVEAGLCMDED